MPSDPSRSRVMTLEAIRYRAGSLQILNQLLLPQETVFDEVRTVQDGYEAIKSMKVRNITLCLLPRSFPVRFHAHYVSPPRVCVFLVSSVSTTVCVAMLTTGVFVSDRVDIQCELCTLSSVLSQSISGRCCAKGSWPVTGSLLKSRACVF